MADNTRRLIVTAASLATVLCIGWVDHATGPDIGFSLFYLVPIAASGWYGGRVSTVLVAALAAASWLAADLAWREDDTAVAISFWNAFTRLVIFTSEGIFIAVLKDDREKLRRLAERESLLARTDSNTGLPNTRAFLERAEVELRRSGTPLAVLYIDLDNFKVFNDRLGHAAGDDILSEVARILRESVEGDDLAARIGGDEFAVLLCCAVDDLRVRRVSDEISEQIASIASMYGDLGFGATIGVAFFHEPPQNAEEMLRTADDAMYRGKLLGKGRVVVQNM